MVTNVSRLGRPISQMPPALVCEFSAHALVLCAASPLLRQEVLGMSELPLETDVPIPLGTSHSLESKVLCC